MQISKKSSTDIHSPNVYDIFNRSVFNRKITVYMRVELSSYVTTIIDIT